MGPVIVNRKCFSGAPAGVAVGVVPSGPANAPPPVQQEKVEIKPQKMEIVEEAPPKVKSTTVAKVKTPADINSVLLQMSGLLAETNESTGDPTFCESCNGALNQFR
jgi:hypothetical protein